MRPWEANIRRVVPYVPGDQPAGSRLIKLNTNENPYPPAPGVIRALKEMDGTAFRKYPDPASSCLVEALAARYGVDKERIFVGVGSDDVLGMAFLTFFNSAKPVLFPDISYSFYPVWADLFGIPSKTPALDGDFRIRPEDYYQENGGVVFQCAHGHFYASGPGGGHSAPQPGCGGHCGRGLRGFRRRVGPVPDREI